ncbi:hypothetical protein WDW89_23230, partial [Deltaproteobacteria bacterium TL4]
MDNADSDKKIQDAIIKVLFEAHRNPKGKFLNVTYEILQREVRNSIPCSREDVLREKRYLVDKHIIKEQKQTSLHKFMGKTMPKFTTVYLSLSSAVIDKVQNGKDWRVEETNTPNRVTFNNSNFYAPFAIGSNNNVVSYNVGSDIRE